MRLSDFTRTFSRIRRWHVGWPMALWLALRYTATGDTGRFMSHGGWRKSRIRRWEDEAQ